VSVTFLDETVGSSTDQQAGEIFEFTGNSGPAILRVAEATDHSTDRENEGEMVASVLLNGDQVLAPRDLPLDGETIDVAVTLPSGTSELEVRIQGPPGSSIDVEVVQHFGAQITSDTIWGGEVSVAESVNVVTDSSLTLLPGTTVAFRHYRGYQEPARRLSLTVQGGIEAIGTPDAPIVFTSDAAEPRNGDWSMVRLETPSGPSVFDYVVFEFGQQGLNVWQGNVTISHSVFRWNNWEGLYFESNSTATVDHCHIYENGYNGIAAEQFNQLEINNCEVWRNGTNGIHLDASTARIGSSLIHDNQANGLSVDDNASITVLGVASRDNQGNGIGTGEGDNTIEVGDVDLSGNEGDAINSPYTEITTSDPIPEMIDLGFVPDGSHTLGYIPGDPNLDRYLYVYPDDATRDIIRTIGDGLGLTWSLAWDGQHLWTSTLWGTISELDPQTGEVLTTIQAPGPQPWGMTFDGTHLWVVDFAEKRISRLDPSTGQEVDSFPTPDPVGGCKGVTWDGTHLNVMGWASPTIYQMTTSGDLVGTIELPEGGGGIAWDGSYFWVPGGPGILRYDTSGTAVGWIYPASEGTWDMTWDGKHLWATQRTNENWPDAKIFALDVRPQPMP
jgi:hypothetical protein